MKRLTTLVLLTILAMPAFGQFTITKNKVESLIGTEQHWLIFEADGPSNAIQTIIDNKGANKNWDFTGLNFDPEGTINNLAFYKAPPPGTFGGNDAPYNTSNFVVIQDDGEDDINSFQSIRDDGVYFIGSTTDEQNNESRVTLTPPILFFPLPFTFGDNWTSTSTITTTSQGTTVSAQEERVNEIDSHGTLVLPHGSFTVLRQKQLITITIQGFSTTQEIYSFFSEDFDGVAAISKVTTPFGTFYTASYLKDNPGGGGGNNPPQSPPANLTPANGATNQPLNPTLSWGAIGNANTYDLQVATDGSFKNASQSAIVVDEKGLTSTSFSVSNLNSGTTYFWRVRGVNANGAGPWATAQTFTTSPGGVTLPSAVTLMSPSNNVIAVTTTPTMTWQAVANADSYQLQVSTENNFSLLVYDNATLTTTSQQIGPLSTGTKFFWRVRAANVAGNGPWSTVFNFSTVISSGGPGAVSQISPPNNATISPRNVPFSWLTETNSVFYHLQVSTQQDFSSTVFDNAGLTETNLPLTLAATTTFYWRIRGRDGTTAGPWSPVRTFTTTATPTDIERVGAGIPDHFALHTNYPNPFNPSTTFAFDLPEATFATLIVYDLTGREVARPVDATLPAGTHQATFEAVGLPSGVYVYRLSAGSFTATKTMLLVK